MNCNGIMTQATEYDTMYTTQCTLHTVKIEVQQNSYLAHDFERSEKE